ncbi:MAG: hypothetical protein AB7G93_23605 [Bdellovibrionales bacterium]
MISCILHGIFAILSISSFAHSTQDGPAERFVDNSAVGLVSNVRLLEKFPSQLPVTDQNARTGPPRFYPWEAYNWTSSEIVLSRQVLDLTDDRAVLIQVHPEYDDGQARRAMDLLARKAAEVGHPQYVLFYSLLPAINLSHQNHAYRVSTKYIAPEGVHEMKFPHTSKFVISGGNFYFCMCTVINELLKTNADKTALQLQFPMQAVFQSAYVEIAEMVRKKRDRTDINGHIVTRESVLRNGFGGAGPSTNVTLKEIYDYIGSDEAFAEWVYRMYKRSDDSRRYRPCLGMFPESEFTLEIRVDGGRSFIFGTGPRRVQFDFSTRMESLPILSNSDTGRPIKSQQGISTK